MGIRGRRFVLVLAGAVTALAAVPAGAQSPSPTGPPAPRIDGEVSGVLGSGGMLVIRSDVTMPGGWQGLHLIEIVVISAGRELERVSYEVETTKLRIEASQVLAGTGGEATGSYLRVGGPQVVVTTGAAELSVRVRAEVVRALPPGTRFRLSATSDEGLVASVVRTIPPDRAGSEVGWGIVLGAVAAALLVGAFAGNLVASRRRPPPKLSVYGAVRDRLDAEGRTRGEGG